MSCAIPEALLHSGHRFTFQLMNADALRQRFSLSPATLGGTDTGNAVIIGPSGELVAGSKILHSSTHADSIWTFDFSKNADDFDYPTENLRPVIASKYLDRLLPQSPFWGAPGYPRLVLRQFLDDALFRGCRGELESLATIHWSDVETDFYSQNELTVTDARLPTHLKTAARALTSDSFRNWLATNLGFVALGSIEFAVHKLVPGDYIGIHNDFRAEGERLRVLIHLGPSAPEATSGCLVAVTQSGEPLEVIPFTENQCVIFRISPESYHLVTEVSEFERFSIILSIYDAEPVT